MKLNTYDLESLDKIANNIDLSLEISDLYLDSKDSKELRRIIRKLLRD